MKTGILIIARLGSTRLQRKHLIEVGGRSFIEWLASRYINGFQTLVDSEKVKVIIATSTENENRTFEEVFKGSSVNVFYGSDQNIPYRQLQCAEEYNLTNVISIDGDDVLCSVSGAISVLERLNSGVNAVKTVGLPLGMNCIGYTRKYLQGALDKFEKSQKIETGWGRIFNSINELELAKLSLDKRLRFTLDYKQDLLFFRKIIEHFGNRIIEATDEDIVNFVIENEVYRLNESLNEVYWNNFNNLKQAESLHGK